MRREVKIFLDWEEDRGHTKVIAIDCNGNEYPLKTPATRHPFTLMGPIIVNSTPSVAKRQRRVAKKGVANDNKV